MNTLNNESMYTQVALRSFGRPSCSFELLWKTPSNANSGTPFIMYWFSKLPSLIQLILPPRILRTSKCQVINENVIKFWVIVEQRGHGKEDVCDWLKDTKYSTKSWLPPLQEIVRVEMRIYRSSTRCSPCPSSTWVMPLQYCYQVDSRENQKGAFLG